MPKRRRERDRPKSGPEALYDPNKRVFLGYDSDDEAEPEQPLILPSPPPVKRKPVMPNMTGEASDNPRRGVIEIVLRQRPVHGQCRCRGESRCRKLHAFRDVLSPYEIVILSEHAGSDLGRFKDLNHKSTGK